MSASAGPKIVASAKIMLRGLSDQRKNRIAGIPESGWIVAIPSAISARKIFSPTEIFSARCQSSIMKPNNKKCPSACGVAVVKSELKIRKNPAITNGNFSLPRMRATIAPRIAAPINGVVQEMRLRVGSWVIDASAAITA